MKADISPDYLPKPDRIRALVAGPSLSPVPRVAAQALTQARAKDDRLTTGHIRHPTPTLKSIAHPLPTPPTGTTSRPVTHVLYNLLRTEDDSLANLLAANAASGDAMDGGLPWRMSR